MAGVEPDRDNTRRLIDLIRKGDREAAALFVTKHADLIRARYRRRLSPALRRLADSQDLVSTVARRLDAAFVRGNVTVNNERQLWALVNTIASRAIADKARVLKRLQKIEGPDSEWARKILDRERQSGDADSFDVSIGVALDSVQGSVNRQIFAMWLSGMTLTQIAEELAMTPAAVRQRWMRIRSNLRDTFLC